MLSWDALEQSADEVTLRVDHRDPASGFDIVEREVEEKGALADSGRPQNMNVMPSVGGGNPGRRLSTVLEQTDDVSVATRPAGWRKMCWGRPKAGDVDGEVEDVRQLVGDQDHAARWRAMSCDSLVEAAPQPDPRRAQAVGAIKAPKCGDESVQLRLCLRVGAGRDSQADLRPIAGGRGFTGRWHRSRWTRCRTGRRGLLGQDEVEEPVQHPAQHGREQAALRLYPG